MRIPASLSKGLSEEQVEQLGRELKSSLLAKQLRKCIQSEIEHTYEYEELDAPNVEGLFRTIGVRRGLRSVLNLLPEG